MKIMNTALLAALTLTSATHASRIVRGEELRAFFNNLEQEQAAERALPPRKAFFPTKDFKVALFQHKTYLRCAHSTPLEGLTQVAFDICDGVGKKMGEILLQYYPEGGYYQDLGATPHLRLRQITLEEDFRRHHHGSRAMETLFAALKAHPQLAPTTLLRLEYNIGYPYMRAWYEKFGFKRVMGASMPDVDIAQVSLNSLRAPYHGAAKKEEAAKKAAGIPR